MGGTRGRRGCRDLDLQLSGNGVQEFGHLRRLAEAGAGRRLHQDVTRDTTVRCIGLGALSYVSKSEGEVHLVAAVRAAAVGDPYTPPALSGLYRAKTQCHTRDLQVRPTAGPGMITRWPHACST